MSAHAACADHPEQGDLDRHSDRADLLAAITRCHGCPIIEACGADAAKIRPTAGMWAGQLWTPVRNDYTIGRPMKLRRSIRRRRWTTAEARQAHVRFNAGHRDTWTVAGESAYHAAAHQRQKAARAGVA